MRETEKGSVIVWKRRGNSVELCDRGELERERSHRKVAVLCVIRMRFTSKEKRQFC